MQFYNPTLEDFKWQANGKMYFFNKRSVVDVYDNVAPFIEEQCAPRGLIALRHGMDFKAAEREGLLRYVRETLENRIQNYNDHKRQMKMLHNIDMEDPIELKRAVNWRREILHMLNQEAPIEIELSYLDDNDRQKLGIDASNVVQFKGGTNPESLVPKNIFTGFSQAEIENGFNLSPSSDSYLNQPGEGQEATIRRGRPKQQVA